MSHKSNLQLIFSNEKNIFNCVLHRDLTVQSTDAREITTRSYEKKYLTLEQKNMIIEHKETTTDRKGQFLSKA